MRPSFDPRRRTGDPGASTEVWRRVNGSPASSSTAGSRWCRHLCERRVSEAESPQRLDKPRHWTASDYTAIAQYPIGRIHQHRRRLPVSNARLSATAKRQSLSIRSPECAAVWVSVRTRPRRRRRGDDPRRPRQTGGPSTFGTQSIPLLISRQVQCASGDAPRGSRRIPSAPAAWTRAIAGSVPHRCGLSVPWACRHARDGPAYHRRATETRCRRVTVPASRSPRSPIVSSTRRPRRKRRRHTGTLQLQTGHDRSPTWSGTRRCCHHRPRENDAKGIGSAPSSSTRLTRGFRVAPEALHRSSRRLPTPASWGQRPPIAALDKRSPDGVGSSHRWTCAAAGHIGVATSARFPLGSSHRDEEGHGRRVPRIGADALLQDAADRFPPSVVAGAGIASTALSQGDGANPRQARGRVST
jgi:hypothetical protein